MPLTLRGTFTACVFFLLPAAVYAWLITGGRFDLVAPSFCWEAYNHYALALARGSQAVPADTIAGEGLYIGGSVYMYYGLLPALIRLALVPFVDLTRVPLANLLVWAMLIAGQWPLQRTVWAIFRARTARPAAFDWGLLAAVSVAIWFSSGAYLIAQVGNLYHEPYAAAVMLSSIFIAMLSRDLLIAETRPNGRRLLAYAVVAGLCIFARQTFAIGLYLATLALLATQPRDRLRSVVTRSVAPLTVLFVFGVVFLALNYDRTGHLGSGWNVKDYGLYIVGAGKARLETMVEQQFSAVRIAPNLWYVLVGGREVREATILALGGGRVATLTIPVRYALFAPFTLIMLVAGLLELFRRRPSPPVVWPLALVAAGLVSTAALQMMYGTMSYRYYAELWPVILWLMLIAMRRLPSPAGRSGTAAVAAMAGLSLVSLAYDLRLRPSLAGAEYFNFAGSCVQPLPPALAARSTAPGSRDMAIYRAKLAYAREHPPTPLPK